MKKSLSAMLLAASLLATAESAFADKHVKGYYRKNGSYVQGYYRSDANKTKLDNYSTRGNVNPYTGKKGYKAPKR